MKRNVIGIYHHPQECGDPYVALVSQETGEMVEAVTVPTGYYDSGLERIDVYTPMYSFVEQVNQSPYPTVDNVNITAVYLPNPKKYVFRVTQVDNIQVDNNIFRTWTADVHVDACKHDIHWNYDPEKDEFLKQLTEEGLDISRWDINKRSQTPFMDFLKEIFSSYKDYHLVNLLEIG